MGWVGVGVGSDAEVCIHRDGHCVHQGNLVVDRPRPVPSLATVGDCCCLQVFVSRLDRLLPNPTTF